MTDIRSVIVADPNTIMLQALSELFERDKRFSLVATSKTAEGFLESCLRVPVDIGVVDWTIPQLGAERLLGILRDRPDAPRIIVYSGSPDPDVPRRAMAAGAAAFLSRDAPEQQLLDVAATVAAGRMVFPYMDVRGLKRDPRDSLTEREKTMLAALAKGRTNTELAAEFERRLRGGVAIMADDALAGLGAAGIVWVVVAALARLTTA